LLQPSQLVPAPWNKKLPQRWKPLSFFRKSFTSGQKKTVRTVRSSALTAISSSDFKHFSHPQLKKVVNSMFCVIAQTVTIRVTPITRTSCRWKVIAEPTFRPSAPSEPPGTIFVQLHRDFPKKVIAEPEFRPSVSSEPPGTISVRLQLTSRRMSSPSPNSDLVRRAKVDIRAKNIATSWRKVIAEPLFDLVGQAGSSGLNSFNSIHVQQLYTFRNLASEFRSQLVLSYSNIYGTQYSSFITAQFCFSTCCSLRPNLISQFTFSTVESALARSAHQLRRYLVKSPVGTYNDATILTATCAWTARCCPASAADQQQVAGSVPPTVQQQVQVPPPGPIDGHQQQVAASAPPAPHHVQVPPPGPIYGYRQQVAASAPPALHQVQAPPMRPINCNQQQVQALSRSTRLESAAGFQHLHQVQSTGISSKCMHLHQAQATGIGSHWQYQVLVTRVSRQDLAMGSTSLHQQDLGTDSTILSHQQEGTNLYQSEPTGSGYGQQQPESTIKKVATCISAGAYRNLGTVSSSLKHHQEGTTCISRSLQDLGTASSSLKHYNIDTIRTSMRWHLNSEIGMEIRLD
ncbi:unnamed protein product, partial [Trichogramma brassicae]